MQASHVEIILYSLNKCLLGTETVKIDKAKALQSPKIPVLAICCRRSCNMSIVLGHPTSTAHMAKGGNNMAVHQARMG